VSHDIDFTAGRPAIAFAGAAPWHRFGAQIDSDSPIEVWRHKAGLDWSALSSEVFYGPVSGGSMRVAPNRVALYRSDTGGFLSIVSDGYKVVQPHQILQFMRDMVHRAGFRMEVAGALLGGRKIWALARVNDGAPVIGQDVVRPYILAATSYDGTMASTFRFTSVRVVCNNTLRMAVSEASKKDGAVVDCVKVNHYEHLDIDEVRRKLGIVHDAWDKFLVNARLLAAAKVDRSFAKDFLAKVLPHPNNKPIEETRSFKKILALFDGDEPMATTPEAKGTAWGLLNSVTWYVDHIMGRNDTRLDSAWFGRGDEIKSRAADALVEAVS
jgi:phage/plasmid-like protein (TIGR03299 family)